MSDSKANSNSEQEDTLPTDCKILDAATIACLVGATALFLKSCLSFTSTNISVNDTGASISLTSTGCSRTASPQRFGSDHLLVSSSVLGGAALITKIISIVIKDIYYRK